MTIDVHPLFEPLKVKGYAFRNRIVMPPMVSWRPITSEDGLDWYAAHAAGGVAMVIVEATPVGRFGDDLTVDGLRTLADAIHAGGALAAIQLFPVDIRSSVKPVDLTPGELAEMARRYESAARVCAEAGFDGAEPHGAHGYILSQFFSPARNARRDGYGGSIENRMRLGLEIAAAVRRGLGAEKLLLYRHTPRVEDSYGLAESMAFARELIKAGVDILDISPSSAEAPGDLAAPFRECGVPVIAVGRMDETEFALEALTAQRADLTAVGRGLIADAQWPRKVREGRMAEIVQCVRCNEKCYGNFAKSLPIECTQW